jgi:hypothetical protein
MNQLTETELASAIREVIKRSVVDPEFRTFAIKNGNEAITKVSGKSVPAGTILNFVSNENQQTKSYALPDPVGPHEELTEEALEQIAGGGCTVTSCGTSSE